MWASATKDLEKFKINVASCYTHSYVGFCNVVSQPVRNTPDVVIPTHMWASATFKYYECRKSFLVVIPTHMWASATN